jgi:putative transposase
MNSAFYSAVLAVYIVNRHVGDLKVRNMSASAAGTIDTLGVNVRAKSGINKSILDHGWSEFRRQLEYKMAWKSGWLVAVASLYTSQICPRCGHSSKDNRKTQAKIKCVGCGFEENAEANRKSLRSAIGIPAL